MKKNAFRAITIVAVSYTHLDVYKRQPMKLLPRNEIAGRLMNVLKAGGEYTKSEVKEILRGIYHDPVSYTHLDVYKRQLIKRVKKLSLSVLKTQNGLM